MEFEFERKAMRGEPMPVGLDIADGCLYIALKNLYAMYKAGLILRRDATKEKQTLVYNWTRDKSTLEFLNRQSDALKNRISEASDAYKAKPCRETADELYAAFWNIDKTE